MLYADQAPLVPVQSVDSRERIALSRLYFVRGVVAQIDANHPKQIRDTQQLPIPGNSNSIGIENRTRKTERREIVRRAIEAMSLMRGRIAQINFICAAARSGIFGKASSIF